MLVGGFHIPFVKDVFFALFGKVTKHRFDKKHRLRVAGHLISIAEPMGKSLVGGVIFAVVGFGGGKLIADALDRRFVWHHGIFRKVKVRPILDMMLISALVVKPGARNARLSAADTYRRAVALVVFYTLENFGGRKLRNVMDDASPDYSAFYTVDKHLILMAENEKEMLKNITDLHIRKLLSASV